MNLEFEKLGYVVQKRINNNREYKVPSLVTTSVIFLKIILHLWQILKSRSSIIGCIVKILKIFWALFIRSFWRIKNGNHVLQRWSARQIFFLSFGVWLWNMQILNTTQLLNIYQYLPVFNKRVHHGYISFNGKSNCAEHRTDLECL